MSSSIFGSRIICDHSYNLVIVINIYTTHTRSCSSEGSRIVLIEAAATSVTSCEQNLAVTVCKNCIEKFVSVTYCDCDHTICTRT